MQVFKNIEIQPLATSTKEDRYLLSCNGQYYEANYPIVELLQILQEYDDEEEAISHYVVLKKMIASDLLGVPNLRKRSKELVEYLLRWVRKQPVKTTPYLLQINGVEKYWLLVYFILVNLFTGYYFFYIIPCFLYRFVLSFPDEMEQFISYLSKIHQTHVILSSCL